jgi:hypothetical protein
MENINQWNAINQWELSSILSSQSNLSINGFDLCSSWIWTTVNYWDRIYDNTILNNWWVDWWFLVSHLLNRGNVSIDFHIKGTDAVDLQKKIDDFKGATARKDLILTVNVWSDVRKMRVNTTNTILEKRGYWSFIQSWSISFEAVDPPRAWSQSIDLKAYQNITAWFTGEINNFGNAETYPIYIFNFRDITDLTSLTWTVNWYPITINHTFADNDTVVISSDLYSIDQDAGVFINNVAVDFDWQVITPLYPEQFWVETNTLQLSVNPWASFECDISILSHKMRE